MVQLAVEPVAIDFATTKTSEPRGTHHRQLGSAEHVWTPNQNQSLRLTDASFKMGCSTVLVNFFNVLSKHSGHILQIVPVSHH